jgi:hypothetical protein
MNLTRVGNEELPIVAKEASLYRGLAPHRAVRTCQQARRTWHLCEFIASSSTDGLLDNADLDLDSRLLKEDIMNIIDLKNQVRRLQSFLKDKPTQAKALAEGKQSACLEAIAAVHGTRDWNTLQASLRPEPANSRTPSGLSSRSSIPFEAGPPEGLEPVFGGLRAGQVHYFIDESDRAQAVMKDLAQAIPQGYRVTVMHKASRAYHHLALCFAGVSTTPARQHEAGGRLLLATVLALDTAGWSLTQAVLGERKAALAVDRSLADLLQTLELRGSRGDILVVDDLPHLQTYLGASFSLLVGALARARDNGAIVVVTAAEQAHLKALRSQLPPSLEAERREVARPSVLH